jgi:hypothetical protein
MNTAAATPWYRYPAVWLLMLAPAAAVVGGIATLMLALKTEDGLVAQDYYKRGLAINRTLAREAKAASLDLQATLTLANGVAHLTLNRPQAETPLTLRFIHPARSGRDLNLALSPTGQGRYQAFLPELAPGRWDVILEADDWRIDGTMHAPANAALTLTALAPAE